MWFFIFPFGYSLQLVGFVRNDDSGESVFGEAQGTSESLKEFAKWLAEVGSPRSRIDKCEIVNEKEIEERSYKEFEFRQ